MVSPPAVAELLQRPSGAHTLLRLIQIPTGETSGRLERGLGVLAERQAYALTLLRMTAPAYPVFAAHSNHQGPGGMMRTDSQDQSRDRSVDQIGASGSTPRNRGSHHNVR